MQRATTIQQELNEISNIVAGIPFVPTYTIPAQYFASLPLFITAKANKDNTFIVPAHYFENLSNNIMERIKLEETDEDNLPPIFSTFKKENVYQAPANYFANTITVPKEEAKIIVMPKRNKMAWVKYAAAACVISIVLFTAYTFMGKKSTTHNDVVINGTNVTFKQIQQINVDAAIDSLNDKEIDNYLCDNGLVACNDDKKADEELQQKLDELDISDDELTKALEESN
jgi:RecG-like helicase